MSNYIHIQGANENNLRNITLDIPKHKLVVVTGPSGSGKSTLALDILQRECQRQYMESSGMSSESLTKPQVDSITGLSPSIAIGQHMTNRNPRSTVGTVTDMYTYLRVIYEKKGEFPCLHCGATISQSAPGKEQDTIPCPACGQGHARLRKADFSFNTLSGACPTCSGMGTVVNIDVNSVIRKDVSIKEGAVVFWYESYMEYQRNILDAAGKYYGISFDGEVGSFSNAAWDLLLYGAESEQFRKHFPDTPLPKTVTKGKFEGVLTGMWRRYKEKNGQSGEAEFFESQSCPDCEGERLKEESRIVTVEGKRLPEITKCSLSELYEWIDQVQLTYQQENDSLMTTLLHDLSSKIKRILHVGLGYLSLDRQAITLSGGEAQRLRLASILGSGLTGVLYILDEPTSGLHPKDTEGLLHVIKELRDLGNTVMLIEHDLRVIQEADHVIDMGPGAGRHGGLVVGQGKWDELFEQESSVTGKYLQGKHELRREGRKGNGQIIKIHHASLHNLKQVTVNFPLGSLISVSGVSGSGKSTLVFDLLAEGAVRNKQNGQTNHAETITGLEQVDKIITFDQGPLTRMQRSSVSTYVDLFSYLRKIYASTAEAKQLGFKDKHFSFNTPGGRCDRCEGLGQVEVNMHFMSDLQVTCPDCQGKRFKPEVLSIKYKDYSISDILDLGIEESLPLFTEHKKMNQLLQLLCEVGLGYLQWGQSVSTLSGGEGQRLKLAKELSSSSAKGHTLYLLDEPSTGLHAQDVENLYVLLSKLVDAGNTVIMVEHNTDLIRASDWVVDMGPGGGAEGGTVVAEGTPDEVAACDDSFTGAFLV